MNPALECHQMDEFSDPVLTQIGICLDKKFQVIGCELTHGGIYGKCPKSGAVEYPATEKLKYQTEDRQYKAGHAGICFFQFILSRYIFPFLFSMPGQGLLDLDGRNSQKYLHQT